MTQAQDIADLKRRVTLLEHPNVLWAADFTKPVEASGFSVQAKYRSRVTQVVRDKPAVRLQTKPGDNNIFGSGDMERCDLALTQELSDGFEGHEAWWHHECLFPDDFSMPTWHMYVIFDFHHTGTTGQANFHLNFDQRGLVFRGYGQGVEYSAAIGQVEKNRWYAFDYHVLWLSNHSGFFDAWVDGKQMLAHRGPTLYAGQGCYLKLANYHTPVCDDYPACIGTAAHTASSVLHAEVRRGSQKV